MLPSGGIGRSRTAGGRSRLPNPKFGYLSWHVVEVLQWLDGIDDGNHAAVHAFKYYQVNGARLAELDDSLLKRMRVGREAVRAKILKAVGLLNHYSDEVDGENLQRLAMQTSLAAGELDLQVSFATPIISDSMNAQRFVEVLTSVLRCVGDLYDSAMRTLLWMDRKPFDENKRFQALREELFRMTEEIVECISDPSNPKYSSIPQVFIGRARAVQRLCQQIVFDPEPSILSTAHYEHVRLKATTFTPRGTNASPARPFEIGCTLSGIHVVTRVNSAGNPTRGGVQVGDEIVQVNGVTVVGWEEPTLTRKLNEMVVAPGVRSPILAATTALPSSRGDDLELLLLKRPRDDWLSSNSPPQINRPRILLSPVDTEVDTDAAIDFATEDAQETSLAISDFKLKTNIDHFNQAAKLAAENTKNRRLPRSASFSSLAHSGDFPARGRLERQLTRERHAGRCLSLLLAEKKSLLRRASVWNESPPAYLLAKSPFIGIQSGSNAWLMLLASWSGEQRGKARARKPEKLRIHPVEDFTDPRVVVYQAQLSTRRAIIDGARVEFSRVEMVNESELLLLKISSPSIYDQEWSQLAAEDITGLAILRRPPMETAISAFSIIDSPLSTIQAKISKFFYGDLTISTNLSATSSPLSIVGKHSTPPPLQPSLTPTEKDVMSMSFSSEQCKTPTPLTPISRFSSEMLFIATTTKDSLDDGVESGGETSSITTAESPLPTISRVRTIAGRRRSAKLAPLAEPDEIGDFTIPTVISAQTSRESPGIRLNELASTPCTMLENELMKGWVKRQRLATDTGRRSESDPDNAVKVQRRKLSQWLRNWMVLCRGGILYLYPNDKAPQADIVIKVKSVDYITREIGLKTSKKHVFALVWNLEALSLAFTSQEEMASWISALTPLTKSQCPPSRNPSPDDDNVQNDQAGKSGN